MNPELKEILISILVGACVAFFTAFFQGIADALNGYGNNVAGGLASSAWYAIKSARWS